MSQKELDEAKTHLIKAQKALLEGQHGEHLEAHWAAAIQKMMEHVEGLETQRPEREE